MAQASANFIGGKMNKTVDERLVPPGEYVDALNVRLGSTEGTELGAVENSLGNSILTNVQYNNLPLGSARTLGCYEDGVNETLYWFINDENNSASPTGKVDLIVSYNTNIGSLTYHVISTSVLNFDKKYLITGVSKIDNLLFFTDDLNPPRVINVTSSYAYAQDAPLPGIDSIFEEEDVSVIVKPPGYEDYDPTAIPAEVRPLGAPHIYLDPDATGQENYIETRFLSFAYRYRYQDGGYSAISLFTQPAFQPNPFLFSISNFTNEGMVNRFKAMDIRFSTGSRRVTEVDLLYKQTTSNVIYVIKRFNKSDLGWPNNGFYTHQFSNSEIYTTLGSDELLRLYDNVPQIAKAQTIQGNRLIYGNYIDGYNLESVEGGSLIDMDYFLEKQSLNITGEPIGNGSSSAGGATPNPAMSTGSYSAGPTGSISNSVLTYDLTEANVTGGITAGTTFAFSFSMEQNSITCTGGAAQCTAVNSYVQQSPFDITLIFTCPVAYTNIDDMLASQEFADRVGGSLAQNYLGPAVVQEVYPCNNSDNGGTLSDKFYGAASETITGSDLVLISGSITNDCATPIAGFPLTCASTPINSGVTDGAVSGFLANSLVDFSLAPSITIGVVIMDLSTGDTASVSSISPGNTGTTDGATTAFLTDSTVDFTTLTNVFVGGTVVDTVGVLSATITSITATTLGIVDLDVGGAAALEATGVAYSIPSQTLGLTDIDGGLATLEVIGASYQITAPGGVVPCAPDGFDYQALGSNKFSLQIPAAQYNYNDGTDYDAFIYYNFIGFGCKAIYLKTADTFSLHSNRDYEVGVVYMDEYARASTVLTSNTSTVYFDPSTSLLQNKVVVQLDNLPPYWAKKYKFVMKPSEGDYMTIYSNLFYQQDGSATAVGGDNPVAGQSDPSLVWFRLEGNNQNILKVGDEIIVKVDSNGAVLAEEKSTVLAIQGFSTKGITKVSLKGLYMLLKPDGWSIERPEDATYYRGNIEKVQSDDNCGGGTCINYYNLNDSNGDPYTIPAGSAIRIKIDNWRGGGGGSCNSVSVKYDKTFISSSDYPSFHDWAVGDDLAGSMITGQASIDEMTLSFTSTLYTGGGSGCFSSQCFKTKCRIRQIPAGGQYFVNHSGIPDCLEAPYDHRPGHTNTRIEVTRGGGVFVFETVPRDADDNLFYDASVLMDIEPSAPGGQSYHMAKQVFDPSSDTWALGANETNQTLGGPLRTTLEFANCFTFGNGVESYRIKDSAAGKGFNLGERNVAISNQDFKEADRYAGMTYSGTFSGSANSNNLNEFNLGLANYKDCETTFGPIQILHARETDILVLQEDRISYVLSGKNVIADSTGGGAIASVPQVLGTQIARIEEYGISFNPESFTSWGSDMFFTDTKRGVVLNLRGASQGSDQLSVVSKMGMSTWFRDQFNVQLTTQKLGAYDPYMNEYVLSTNGNQVPVPIPKVPCGTNIEQFSSSSAVTYEVDLGLVIGIVDVDYTVTSGSITIDIDWGGTITTAGPLNTSGTFTFNKSSNTPDFATVTITPSVTSQYSVTVQCPPEIPLTIIEVVVNSTNYAGESIHTKYGWTDGTNISSNYTIAATLGIIQPSEYDINGPGIRSIGVFPYSGTDITLGTSKIAPDNFDFNPLLHRFKILSSNTLYTSSVPDINSLLSASSIVSPIINPTPNIYSATETGFNMPIGNQYLYLVYDLRLITEAEICYCDDGPIDVCCDCSVGCNTAYFGPLVFAQGSACSTDVNTPGNLGQLGFTGGSGSLPGIGSYVFSSIGCDIASGYADSGYYCVNASGAGGNTNIWIQVNSGGVVVNSGTC